MVLKRHILHLLLLATCAEMLAAQDTPSERALPASQPAARGDMVAREALRVTAIDLSRFGGFGLQIEEDGSGKYRHGSSPIDSVRFRPGTFDVTDAATELLEAVGDRELRPEIDEAAGPLEYLDLPEDDSLFAVRLRFEDGSRKWCELPMSNESLARLFDSALRANVTTRLALNFRKSPPVPHDAGISHKPSDFVHIRHRREWLLTVHADGSARYGFGVDSEISDEHGNTNVIELPAKTFDYEKVVQVLSQQREIADEDEALAVQNAAVLVDYHPHRRVRLCIIPDPLVIDLYTRASAAGTNDTIRRARTRSPLLRQIP